MACDAAASLAGVRFTVAVDVVVGRRGAWMSPRFGTPRSTLEAISGSLSGAREAEVQEERRLQYVAVGGVVIEGGRWRDTTVRGRNGAAVVRWGGGMQVGKGARYRSRWASFWTALFLHCARSTERRLRWTRAWHAMQRALSEGTPAHAVGKGRTWKK